MPRTRNDEALGESWRSQTGSNEYNQSEEGYNERTAEILFTTSEGREESRNEIREDRSVLVLPVGNQNGGGGVNI